MNKITSEIIIKEAPEWRVCNCCGCRARKEIDFHKTFPGGHGQGTIVALCEKCEKELVSKLQEGEKQ